MRIIYTFLLAFSLPVVLPAQIVFQLSSTTVSCFGGANGTAHATASGGTAPYSYAWSTGEQGESISGLQAGAYTVTATDNTGLTASKSVTVIQPPPVAVTLNGQPQICDVAPDGFVYAIPSGGTPPFSYSWNNSIAVQLNNHLAAGTYTVTVSDVKGCTITKSYEVNHMGAGLYLFSTAEKAHCPMDNDGSAYVTAASGTAPFTYLWSNGMATDTVHDLSSGLYHVTVSDVNGCSAVSTSSVGLAPLPAETVHVQDVQCLHTPYDYTANQAFSAFNWILDNPVDSIVAGKENDLVTIMWGEPGMKAFRVEMSDTSTNCFSTIYYSVQANVCAVETLEPAQLESAVVTPNPFSDHIDIQRVTEKVNCSLYALDGTLMLQATINNDDPVINTANLPAGMYLLKLNTARESRSWKLIHE